MTTTVIEEQPEESKIEQFKKKYIKMTQLTFIFCLAISFAVGYAWGKLS